VTTGSKPSRARSTGRGRRPSRERLEHHLDAAERVVGVRASELVVIPGDVDDPGALPRLPQDLLDDVVVGLRPVPPASQHPPVEQVADDVQRVRVVVAQELEELLGLGRARAEVHVRQPDRPVPAGELGVVHLLLPSADLVKIEREPHKGPAGDD